MCWERDVLVWETAALDPDSPVGDTISREHTCPCLTQKLGAQSGPPPQGTPFSSPCGPLCLAHSSFASRGPMFPKPLSGEFLVLMVGPLRFVPHRAHRPWLSETSVMPEVPSLSPLAPGPSVPGFLILFLELNYDYTASLRRADLK